MIDKLIHYHLDKQDKLEIAIEDEIDMLIKMVSLDKIINNPEEVLLAFIEEVKNNIKENYAQEAIENGIQFAKDVRKAKKDIKIQCTNNPQLNKENDKSNDKR